MKKGIFAVVLCLAMTSTFAMTIDKGHLIEQKEWTTGSGEFLIKDTPLSMPKPIQSQDGVLLKNNLTEDKGIVGVEANINGLVEIYIENLTKVSQTYTIYESFCVDKAPLNNCTFRSYTIQIDPNGHMQSNVKRIINKTFAEEGSYASTLITSIEKDNVAVASTYSKGMIHISQAG